MSLTIHGGKVLTPEGLVKADVVVEGSKVISVGSASPQTGQIIDAAGCLVGPGFVDLHVHFRDPGQTWKEDLSSGSRAAAAGGFTGVIVMPNTDPALDSPDSVSQVIATADQLGLVEAKVAAALTIGRSGAEATDIESLAEVGVTMFSDDGDSVADDTLVESLMSRVKAIGGVISQHAEHPAMTRGGHMHQGDVSEAVGLGGLPTEAETAIVARDLELSRITGCRYHCQHVSSADTVELISSAKQDGLPVTAEVTPHHLWFTDVDVAQELNTDFKMYPPLRSEADRDALRSALLDGIIDCVATDHAPHTAEEKAVAFEDAPRGVTGLETSAAATWMVVGEPRRFFEVMSTAPAAIGEMGRQGQPIAEGSPANLVVFAPDEIWAPVEFQSKSTNSPFTGLEMQGRVRATIFEGKVTHQLSMTT